MSNILINREIYTFIRDFFATEKKALLISGARQVGKTFAIRHVAHQIFENVIELNFAEQPALKDIFNSSRSTKEILTRISVMTGDRMVKGKTLIFFDEVQECPEVITAIKFLVEEGSYRYALSGSLLGVQLCDIRSVPVGYLTERRMYPLNLAEFMQAVGMSQSVTDHIKNCFDRRLAVDSVIHRKMLELVNLYLVVGGMPEVVAKYLATGNIEQVRATQTDILNAYHKDIAKYDLNNKLYIQEIFDIIPAELDAKNKRFVLTSLSGTPRFDRLKNSFLWMTDAGVALPTYNINEPRVPLQLNMLRNLFKLFLNDVGLLSRFCSAEVVLSILNGKADINFGAIYENLAAQELASHDYKLYYFNSKRQGELDFVIEHNGHALPIEIKSGKDYKRHNALSNVMSSAEYDIPMAMVFSNGNVESDGRVLYLPIYMLMHIKEARIENPVFQFTPL